MAVRGKMRRERPNRDADKRSAAYEKASQAELVFCRSLAAGTSAAPLAQLPLGQGWSPFSSRDAPCSPELTPLRKHAANHSRRRPAGLQI